MKINIVKMKKAVTIFLIVIVSLLVVFAVYTNKSRFYSSETVKYSQITIDEKTDIQYVINRYANNGNRDRFISELKKVNNLSDLSDNEVYGRTIYVPLINN